MPLFCKLLTTWIKSSRVAFLISIWCTSLYDTIILYLLHPVKRFSGKNYVKFHIIFLLTKIAKCVIIQKSSRAARAREARKKRARRGTGRALGKGAQRNKAEDSNPLYARSLEPVCWNSSLSAVARILSEGKQVDHQPLCTLPCFSLPLYIIIIAEGVEVVNPFLLFFLSLCKSCYALFIGSNYLAVIL